LIGFSHPTSAFLWEILQSEHCWMALMDAGALQTEQVMMQSLHTITKKAVTDYITTKREDWLLKWPGQVVLAVSQIFWTRAVEDALRSAGTEGLQKFAQECAETLRSEVELVRGELTKLQRATLGAQVVIDVHARDVLAEMARDGVCSATDFAWQAQLRFVPAADCVGTVGCISCSFLCHAPRR
jgi:dynein heavy chain, axonemal